MIVNPFGGQGTGMKLFTTSVEPLLKAAGISYTLKGRNVTFDRILRVCPRFFCRQPGFLTL